MSDTVKLLATLAQEVEVTDPIDWGMLSVDENTAYNLISANVIEQWGEPRDERELGILATMTKLIVENFVLNLKLLEAGHRE